jgi:hypothetical protein
VFPVRYELDLYILFRMNLVRCCPLSSLHVQFGELVTKTIGTCSTVAQTWPQAAAPVPAQPFCLSPGDGSDVGREGGHSSSA